MNYGDINMTWFGLFAAPGYSNHPTVGRWIWDDLWEHSILLWVWGWRMVTFKLSKELENGYGMACGGSLSLDSCSNFLASAVICALTRGPKDQINISIPHSDSKAQDKGDARNHGL